MLISLRHLNLSVLLLIRFRCDTFAFINTSPPLTLSTIPIHSTSGSVSSSLKKSSIEQSACFPKLCSSTNSQQRNHLTQLNVAAGAGAAGAASVAILPEVVATNAAARGIGSYFLTRIVFLRSLAFVYFVAFVIAYRQNKGLIGDSGITPGKELGSILQ